MVFLLSECTVKLRKIIETLLVEEKEGFPDVRLKFFNLSRGSSVQLFDSIIKGFLEHPNWQECFNSNANAAGLYGTNCPIRINYELLCTPLVQGRIRALLELCDLNGLHLPIRQILLLLANAILGHPDVKDHLMSPADVPTIIAQNTCAKASIYNNLFGGNLSDARRQSITIFDYFDRFQIGHETCNRIDNLLIYGETDQNFQAIYDRLVKKDIASGANDFAAAKYQYIECADEDDERTKSFLQLLISQRRGLFFKIPSELEKDLGLWELTVFKFAGEYLSEVVGSIRQHQEVERTILYRLIKGLNRIFTGMLINSEREIYLASNGNYSQGRISRIMIDRVSVNPNKGERIVWGPQTNCPTLQVYLNQDTLPVEFAVNLTRYEFLSRVASEGALPASFSKECYEDILAFKSMLIAAALKRPYALEQNRKRIDLRVLSVGTNGAPEEKYLEVKL